MNKIIYMLLGCLLISISNVYSFLYLNLLNMGYNFLEYLIFILKRIECLMFIPGIIILYFKVYK